MSDNATAQTVHETAEEHPPQKQVITHMIGDITVIVMLPQGCPQPHVELTFHRYGVTDATLAAALDAVALTHAAVKEHDDTRWKQAGTPDGGMTATVFLP